MSDAAPRLTVNHPTIAWLLDAATPTIRYRTLTELLDRPVADPAVAAARAAIRSGGPVPGILAGQTPTGGWAPEHNTYQPKYLSTHWNMLLLAELGLGAEDEQFRRGACFMLEDPGEVLTRRLDPDEMGVSCYYGNILRYVCQAGVVDHPRLPHLIAYTVRDLRDGSCRCRFNEGYACGWGVARTLWGLVALSEAQRTQAVDAAIDRGIRFLLTEHNLAAGDFPVPEDGKIHSMWGRLNFPLFYQGDILYTLRVLSELDALAHPGAQPALEWLAARRQRNGRWRGASPYRSRTWPIFPPAEVDRWVTLQALMILRRAGRPVV